MRIVLPEGTDWHVVVAASELLERDLCELFILGEPEKVRLRGAGWAIERSGMAGAGPAAREDRAPATLRLVWRQPSEPGVATQVSRGRSRRQGASKARARM
jgi:phosphate acetyltransferase